MIIKQGYTLPSIRLLPQCTYLVTLENRSGNSCRKIIHHRGRRREPFIKAESIEACTSPDDQRREKSLACCRCIRLACQQFKFCSNHIRAVTQNLSRYACLHRESIITYLLERRTFYVERHTSQKKSKCPLGLSYLLLCVEKHFFQFKTA